MKLVSDNDNPTKINVVHLQDVTNRFVMDGCQHNNVRVDEILNHVVCADCKAELNPIVVLVRMARKGSQYGDRLKAMKEMQKKLEARKRCKCDHCHKMTTIRL